MIGSFVSNLAPTDLISKQVSPKQNLAIFPITHMDLNDLIDHMVISFASGVVNLYKLEGNHSIPIFKC